MTHELNHIQFANFAVDLLKLFNKNKTIVLKDSDQSVKSIFNQQRAGAGNDPNQEKHIKRNMEQFVTQL